MKTARELGIAIVAYSPIGRGMLGGNIRHNSDLEDGDTRKSSPRCKSSQIEVFRYDMYLGTFSESLPTCTNLVQGRTVLTQPH